MKTELEVITMIAKLEKKYIDLSIEMSYTQSDSEADVIQDQITCTGEKIEALEWVLNL